MSWCGGGAISVAPHHDIYSIEDLARDPVVELVARQLAAFARLGALRDLDLQIVGVDEVVGGHAEPAGRDLLDRAPPQVAVLVDLEAVRLLAALAGVRARAE